jgi:hypothetical protein
LGEKPLKNNAPPGTLTPSIEVRILAGHPGFLLILLHNQSLIGTDCGCVTKLITNSHAEMTSANGRQLLLLPRLENLQPADRALPNIIASTTM